LIKAELIDHMGTDLSVVNAARVSFDKASEWIIDGYDTKVDEESRSIYEYPRYKLKDSDANLIRFLARGCSSGDWDAAVDHCHGENFVTREEIEAYLKWAKNMPTHWTPFGHTAITLREHIPIFVARQRFKHNVGFVYNEVSRRYVTSEPEFYVPDVWRKAATDKKQGSTSEPAPVAVTPNALHGEALDTYRWLLDNGVCAEQARMVLPQSMMTTYWVTGNLYSFAQAYKARSRPDAQKEIRDLAAEWDRIIRPLFPVSWAALVD